MREESWVDGRELQPSETGGNQVRAPRLRIRPDEQVAGESRMRRTRTGQALEPVPPPAPGLQGIQEALSRAAGPLERSAPAAWTFSLRVGRRAALEAQEGCGSSDSGPSLHRHRGRAHLDGPWLVLDVPVRNGRVEPWAALVRNAALPGAVKFVLAPGAQSLELRSELQTDGDEEDPAAHANRLSARIEETCRGLVRSLPPLLKAACAPCASEEDLSSRSARLIALGTEFIERVLNAPLSPSFLYSQHHCREWEADDGEIEVEHHPPPRQPQTDFSTDVATGAAPGAEVEQEDSRERATADLLQIIAEAGWSAKPREGGGLVVDLGARGRTYRAEVECRGAAGVRALAPLAQFDALSESSEEAIGLFLLTASRSLRAARAVAAPANDGPRPTGTRAFSGFQFDGSALLRAAAGPRLAVHLEAWVPRAYTSAELLDAIAALAMGCLAWGPETEALADETLARAYLRARGWPPSPNERLTNDTHDPLAPPHDR